MMPRRSQRQWYLAAVLMWPAVLSGAALAQSCPEPLASARRLVLVTADTMATPAASLRRYQRPAPGAAWQALGAAEPALIGHNGMAWSFAFRDMARDGELVKLDGDKRAPAGIYRIGRSFGFAPSSRPGYLRLRDGTVCVDDPVSRAYNTISSRAKVGWTVHGENMWRVPAYRNGLLVDYPTNAGVRGGSCIFIHVRLSAATGTSGCIALPEPRVTALQEFSQAGAVLALMPRQALSRLGGCLPDPAAR